MQPRNRWERPTATTARPSALSLMMYQSCQVVLNCLFGFASVLSFDGLPILPARFLAVVSSCSLLNCLCHLATRVLLSLWS